MGALVNAPSGNGLRDARRRRGWSQSEAARELAALGEARGTPVAAAPSLKTLLSRWENGHALPEPQYRALLAELFGRTPAELGIDAGEAPSGAAGLRAEIAAAAAVDTEALALWCEQLSVARRLDDELGAAGASGLVRAQVEQLERTLAHILGREARRAVAAVLAEAARLAGAQALDRADHDIAWGRYVCARSAAAEAGLPGAAAAAVAGMAAVLVDIGEPTSAIALLDEWEPADAGVAHARWQAARGLASAAAGRSDAARAAFAAAERALGQVTIDVVWGGTPPVELADLHRWHGSALATLGDTAAAGPLRRALAAQPRSTRHRAALHADLAAALATSDPPAAAAHALTARELAARIGSARIAARLAGRPPP